MDKTPKTALVSLAFNVSFCAFHIVFGAATHSWWLFTVGVYYCVLSAMRFVVIRKKRGVRSVVRFTGVMLMVLSVPLAGTVILSLVNNRGHKIHLIPMLAIATYSFAKITLATIGLIKSIRVSSEKSVALRNISFATALVSIFSLQRSMLVTFEGMTDSQIVLMNALTGTGACILVFLLGLNLVRKKKLFFKVLK